MWFNPSALWSSCRSSSQIPKALLLIPSLQCVSLAPLTAADRSTGGMWHGRNTSCPLCWVPSPHASCCDVHKVDRFKQEGLGWKGKEEECWGAGGQAGANLGLCPPWAHSQNPQSPGYVLNRGIGWGTADGVRGAVLLGDEEALARQAG